jgi:hypothetical protein
MPTMTAVLAIPLHPVQLTLDLRTPTVRRLRIDDRRPYWQHVDLADLGGELRARRPGINALVTAHQSQDGRWIGYHDLVLDQTGSSGATRPQSTRGDALASAAHGMAQHCNMILARRGGGPTSTMTATRQLLRWLAQVDLL